MHLLRISIAALLTQSLIFATTRSFAQATIFEVPSGEAPKTGNLFFQEQVEVSRDLDSSTLAVVGLPEGFDVGAVLHRLSFEREDGKLRYSPNEDDRTKPLAPLALLTAEKLTKIRGPLAIDFGLQVGPNVAKPSNMVTAMRAYADLVVTLGEHGTCVAGAYVANTAFVGDAAQARPWTGCDLEIVPDVFGVEADWDFGNHQQAGATLGPKVFFGEHVDLAAGWRIPNPWAPSHMGAVVQLEVKDVLPSK